jgi:hypothetical protein
MNCRKLQTLNVTFGGIKLVYRVQPTTPGREDVGARNKKLLSWKIMIGLRRSENLTSPLSTYSV